MKLRLLIVILVVSALFSGVVLWRVDRFVYGDRMAWAEAQARSQVSSLSQAIAAEVQSARRMLATVNADTFKPDRTNWRAFQPYYALALMTTQNGALGITQMTTKSDSVAAGWNANQLTQFIGPLGKAIDSRSSVILRAFKDNKKNPHVAVIFAGGGVAYILVGSGGSFQSLIESQRGSLNSFSIVSSEGLTISHGVPEYIGTVMGDSTLMKEIRSTGASQGLGTYIQGNKQVFGFYEQVPGASAYVISTVPIEDLIKGRLSLAWQFVFLGIGFVLIGAAGYFWYEKRNPRAAVVAAPAAPRQEVLPPIPSVSMENVISPPPSQQILNADVITTNSVLAAPMAPKSTPPRVSNPAKVGGSIPAPVTPPDWQQEKAEAYRQVAVAMGQEMRAPLASILGFSQMVLSKTQDPDVVQAVESILREARSSRDVLDKLVTYSGERKSQKSESKIEGPIVMALKTLNSRIQDKGVQIEKDFKETSPWPIATEDLAKAFENFLENAIEAMERMQEKVIKISTWEDAQGLHVTIKDSGEGIDRENLGKVFEPFFTTRSYANHVGLGLPVSAGILKEHQAKVKIQSQRGQGTQVDILFPPGAQVAETANVAAPMAAQELPAELPKMSTPSSEEVEVAMKGTEIPAEKLTDMNVDSLLEMPPEDAPLQFLDGLGFAEEAPAPPPPMTIPPPVMSQPPPKMSPPAVTPNEQVVVILETEEPTRIAPPSLVQVEEPLPEPTVIAPAAAVPSVVIDKPSAPAGQKNSALDSYKVEVKRPGKRT